MRAREGKHAQDVNPSHELEGEPPERFWYDELIRIKRDRDRALRELGVPIEPEPGDRMP